MSVTEFHSGLELDEAIPPPAKGWRFWITAYFDPPCWVTHHDHYIKPGDPMPSDTVFASKDLAETAGLKNVDHMQRNCDANGWKIRVLYLDATPDGEAL